MATLAPPSFKPLNPNLGSGPCSKRPGFNEFRDDSKVLGRSHRAGLCKKRINLATAETLRLLGCPATYQAGFLPVSDAPAVELLAWALFSDAAPVTVCHPPTPNPATAAALVEKNLRSLGVPFTSRTDTKEPTDPKSDVFFAWTCPVTGTTTPDAAWIPDAREGLVVCDATSACFSEQLPWEKLDLALVSLHAVGGEPGAGILVVSPRAAARLEQAAAARPLPKIFRILGKGVADVCAGNVINTISMMTVEDYLKCLGWAEAAGGVAGMCARVAENGAAVDRFVEGNKSFVQYSCEPAARRAKSCVLLTVTPPKGGSVKALLAELESSGVAYDIDALEDNQIRIGCGCTVDAVDITRCLEWLKYCATGKQTATPPAPSSNRFGSGPCKKPPGADWFLDTYNSAGRTSDTPAGKAAVKRALDLTTEVLKCPPGYRACIVPGSDTGAVEMLIWSLLGGRKVDVFHWESFGTQWASDLKLLGVECNSYKGEYGQLPDLSKADKENDLLFTWNGTTSGVKLPNGDWIPQDRKGWTICDATSAAFAQDLPWEKLDLTTFSWQKALGGEAGHGVIVLSPKVLDYLRSASPVRPVPDSFNLCGGVADRLVTGSTLCPVSMLSLNDYVTCLRWSLPFDGAAGLKRRTEANFSAVKAFVDRNQWASFLAEPAENASTTSVCLVLKAADGAPLPEAGLKAMLAELDSLKVAHDINSYRDAPAGIRIWCGCTVDALDVALALDWLEYVYAKCT